jgi:DNA-binding response OmpR family regulator
MLRTSSFVPLTAESGKDGIRLAATEKPDVVLLDVNMPEMNGYEVCKRLREQPATRMIPVIMLTTQGSLDSRVKGLEIGADDYIPKPFQIRELVARINAKLRRIEVERKVGEPIAVGNLKLDPKSFSVQVNEQPVKLTQVEFELLRYFLEHPNQVIGRKTLLNDLWPDAVVTDRTIDTHMANLRRKIKGFVYTFETIYGAGYILKMS